MAASSDDFALTFRGMLCSFQEGAGHELSPVAWARVAPPRHTRGCFDAALPTFPPTSGDNAGRDWFTVNARSCTVVTSFE
jgi:hypothetical protein